MPAGIRTYPVLPLGQYIRVSPAALVTIPFLDAYILLPLAMFMVESLVVLLNIAGENELILAGKFTVVRLVKL